MGDGPGRGGSGATGGRDGGGLLVKNALSGRADDAAELGPFADGGKWFVIESCGDGGMYVGGVGKDSRIRGTGGRFVDREEWVLPGVGGGIVAGDGGGRVVVVEPRRRSVVRSGSIPLKPWGMGTRKKTKLSR